MKKITIAFIAIFFAAISVAKANDEQGAIVVVTPGEVQQNLGEISAHVDVIDQSQIENSSQQDLVELIASTAGVDMSRNGGQGQLASIFIRGGESRHTLIMVDGVSINQDIGQASLQDIPLANIERIEIVKGASASTLYGNQAMGGVINIITKKPQLGWHGQTQVELGSYASLHRNAKLGYKGEHVYGAVGIYRQKSTGPSATTRVPDDESVNSEMVTVNFGANYLGFGADLKHHSAKGATEYDPSYGNADLHQDFDNHLSAVDFSYRNDSWQLNLLLSDTADKSYQQPASADYAKSIKSGARMTAVYNFAANSNLLVGVEQYQHQFDALSFGNKIDQKRQRAAAFAKSRIGIGRSTVDFGVRQSKYEKIAAADTGNFSYALRIIDNWQVFAAYDSAFTAPSLGSMYGFGANLNLKPERAESTTLGVVWANQQQYLKLSLFDTKYKQLINFDMSSRKMRNIAAAKNQGGEISYKITSGNFSTNIAVSSQRPRDEKTNLPLLRRADFSASAGVAYKLQAWGVSFDVAHVGKRRDFGLPSTHILKSYTVLNAAISYRPNQYLSFLLAGKNLGDEKYQTAYGYNTPKRSAFFNVKLQF